MKVFAVYTYFIITVFMVFKIIEGNILLHKKIFYNVFSNFIN